MSRSISDLLMVLERSLSDTNETLSADFLPALDEIASSGDAAAIEPLLHLLDDNAPFEGPMWSIMHVAEGLGPSELYVPVLLRSAPAIRSNAPEWSRRLFIRVLNHPESCEQLTRLAHSIPGDQKPTVRAILSEVIDASDDFHEKASPVLAALKSAG